MNDDSKDFVKPDLPLTELDRLKEEQFLRSKYRSSLCLAIIHLEILCRQIIT